MRTATPAISVVVLALTLAGCGSRNAERSSRAEMQDNMSLVAARGTAQAVRLRVSLDQLLGEHAMLAVEATQRKLEGGKDFPAIVKQLDANSVALSRAIASVYGGAAGKQFLNGRFLWRDHIRFFVAYAVATVDGDVAGKQRAVTNLMSYVQRQAAFFAETTGLPQQALVDDLTAHVLQLKGQLDAYARGDYARAAALTHSAYAHMFMTGDTLAAGIASQQALGATTGGAADLQVTLDRLLGEHALLATWATRAGLRRSKNFPAVAQQLDRNSVELSQAIGSIYGRTAANRFLNGKHLWQSHIADLVVYTNATRSRDRAAQKSAVERLRAYVVAQSAFFASATGLPRKAIVDDLNAHILQLKGALDSYDAQEYRKTFSLVHGSYEHMFMTGSDLASAIAKQKNLN